MTTPTASMLAAITSCTLLDDVFNEDPTTEALEAHCAALTGKDAGLLVLSGTMGNQVALRALLTQPPHSVLCDHRSHIVKYEAGGYVRSSPPPLSFPLPTQQTRTYTPHLHRVSSLTGALIQPITPSNGRHLTLSDIQAHAHLDDDVHSCPTRVISLENTINGIILPLASAQAISSWARAQPSGIKLHCDGARLWEAAAAATDRAPGQALKDYAACFDTISLCFSKGLGAPIGSVLVGDRATIKHARWIRKSLGGGLRQAGVVAAAARVAVDETFGLGDDAGKLLRKTHELAREVAGLWTGLGGKLEVPVETNMVWLDLKAAGVTDDRMQEVGKEEGLKLMFNRMVVHYQIYQNREVVMKKLERVFRKVLAEGTGIGARKKDGADEKSMYSKL
jgi:threonine aldolase